MISFLSFNLVSITTQHNTLVADANDEFHVTCSARRRITAVQWYRDDELINTNDSRVNVVTSRRLSVLTIMNVRQSDSGHYQCEVNNNQRSATSVFLNVISK